MRRVLNIIIFLSLLCPVISPGVCYAADKDSSDSLISSETISKADNVSKNSDASEAENAPILPSIFIWQLPDDSEEDFVSDSNDEEDTVSEEYSDDIYYTKYESAPLKGYLEYMDDSNVITLKNSDKELALNLTVPQNLKSKSLSKQDYKVPSTTFARNIYSRSDNLQYNIAPVDTKAEYKEGGFSLGTAYNESIDTSDLGFTTSFYTKYETKHFSLQTSYAKESGVDYSLNVDKFSLTPELKLNNYISIKDIITSDITRNRKKNELVLSIKPTKDDRVRFEFGANYTFDENNELVRSQVKFSTHFKL